MTQNMDYVSLEHCCSALKNTEPQVLGDIANQLLAVADPESEFNPQTIYVRGDPDGLDSPPITYSSISNYFKQATGRYVPVLFETQEQAIESCFIMVNREWLGARIDAARQRIGTAHKAMAEGLHTSHVLKVANGRFAGIAQDQPPPIDSAGLRNLQKKLAIQSDQRKAQEAASRDAIALLSAENRLAVAEALLAEARAREKVLTEENRNFYNELNAKDRKIQDRELQIADLTDRLAKYAACFNGHSPLHPAALSEAFDCWDALTKSGTFDPSGPGGRGAKPLVLEWLRSRGETDLGTLSNPSAKVKRLAVIIGWRGAGSGAIRSR
ncbi:hypothetical protein [Pseudomonas bijieensis]|uniref:hypothetical protein n=1 Tax=Pseudomonas bijieensis TaxID=2681983 RepID=UPI001E4C8720|nr:hypothetical protein [Pseudomonas bijieensis]MCD9117634.1 hypothetical protein [Pseudomonas bijieensis]